MLLQKTYSGQGFHFPDNMKFSDFPWLFQTKIKLYH